MQLRDHPLIAYRGISSWPPVWTLIRGNAKERIKGEVGILKELHVSAVPPDSGTARSYNRIFLFIEHDGRGYIGCLMLEDYSFCQQLAKLLPSYYGRPIEQIGSIDLGHTL